MERIEHAPNGRPDCTLDKAAPIFKPIVAWLLDRTPREKLAAIALVNLMLGDVQQNIKDTKRYAGQIGDDLRRDWRKDVVRIASEPANDGRITRFVLDCENVYDVDE
jgi:hypothetical protein